MAGWRLIVSGADRGSWNLALDEAIFRAVAAGKSPPTVRFYGWSPPAVSIGYAQSRERDVDLEACAAAGVAVLRRITGGRAVLHDAEVTYAVACPAAHPPFGGGLDADYRRIAEGILAGLRALGVRAPEVGAGPAARGPERAHGHPACFGAAGRHEISVGGRKLVGSAQRRESGAFLQQGSLLLRGHAARLSRLLRGSPREGAPWGMTGLAELLEPCPDFGAVCAALAQGFEAAWGARLAPGAASDAELRAAAELDAFRYGAEAWSAAAGRAPAQGETR